MGVDQSEKDKQKFMNYQRSIAVPNSKQKNKERYT
jgi:hypothetical protein